MDAVCDGMVDCPDESDEFDCPMTTTEAYWNDLSDEEEEDTTSTSTMGELLVLPSTSCQSEMLM